MNYRSICFILVMLTFMTLFQGEIHAKGVYVRDWITISVRNNPYESSKIIGMANTNDYLEILENQGEWVKVRTPGGNEGWVQERFLTSQTPKALIIDQLNEKVRSLAKSNKDLREENKDLQKENREKSYKISSFTKETEKIQSEYDVLKDESSTYLELKQKYEVLVDESTSYKDEIDLLTRENNRLKTSERMIFILIGGGFVLAGILIGFLMQLQRGKPKKTGYKF